MPQRPRTSCRTWTKLIQDYLVGRANLARVYVLIDARHGLKDADTPALDALGKAAVSHQIVLTKADQVKASELAERIAAVEAELKKRPAAFPHVLPTSSRGGGGIPELRAAIARLKKERGSSSAVRNDGGEACLDLLEPRARRAGTVPMNDKTMTDPQEQARILSEALPHMQRYDEETIVIKYGGHAMGDEATGARLRQGHRAAGADRDQPGRGARRRPADQRDAEEGRRASRSSPAGFASPTPPRLEIVEMVLAGSINKQIVGYINAAGGKAIGLCGKDGNMVLAKKSTRRVIDPGSNIEKVVDLGFVGEPDKVDLTVLNTILGKELIPVLAPVCAAADGGSYNVNADTFAGAIAGALKAKRFLLLTDVPGVLDKNKELIKEMSAADVRKLIADGTISGGMIPKVETCLYALEKGVEGVVILDGKVPHAVLLELFTDLGSGTLIHR